MFINYKYPAGCSVDTFRNNGTSCGDDIVEFALSVQRRETVNFTVNAEAFRYEDELSDALRDGVLEYNDALESVYATLGLVTCEQFEEDR